MIALAQEVAAMGFDEVQFDYLRFPSDGQTKGLAYSQENTLEKRTAMMAEFCAQTYAALNLTPAFFSADVFGLTVWVAPSNDMGIGQRLDDIVPSVDYVSPMLYPSTFIPGNLGLDNPGRYPYEVINRSVIEDAGAHPADRRPRVHPRASLAATLCLAQHALWAGRVPQTKRGRRRGAQLRLDLLECRRQI